MKERTHATPRVARDFSRALREYTEEELMFLKLHAVYGPLLHAHIAAQLLGYASEAALRESVKSHETPLTLFRPPNRLKVLFASALPLARLMVSRRIGIPTLAVPEPWSFSTDDTAGPEILVLGRPLTAREFRSLTVVQLTELRMHARYGPVMTSAKAAQLLAFTDSASLLSAIAAGRFELNLAAAEGRHKLFASTRLVSRILADLAIAHEDIPTAPQASTKWTNS